MIVAAERNVCGFLYLILVFTGVFSGDWVLQFEKCKMKSRNERSSYSYSGVVNALCARESKAQTQTSAVRVRGHRSSTCDSEARKRRSSSRFITYARSPLHSIALPASRRAQISTASVHPSFPQRNLHEAPQLAARIPPLPHRETKHHSSFNPAVLTPTIPAVHHEPHPRLQQHDSSHPRNPTLSDKICTSTLVPLTSLV